MLAHDMARAEGGEFLLRIEDIDQSRARDEWEELIFEDLAWLGLTWDGPVMRQSERIKTYQKALKTLWSDGILFACTCNRRDIIEAASAPQEGAPIHGPDGIVYPGTCRTKPRDTKMPMTAALRLDMARALATTGRIEFLESGPSKVKGAKHTYLPEVMLHAVGDVVLARRDMGTSYHLAVVLDDADQEITHVIRGEDLFDATQIHVVLQNLLGLPTPIYHHHRLIRDDAGKRLAKRDDARAIRKYREDGATPDDIRVMVGLRPRVS